MPRLPLWPTLCVALALLASPLTRAADQAVVRWQVYDLAPYHLIAGPDAGRGVRDAFVRALQDDLPEFAHQTEVSSVQRTVGLARTGESVCTVSILKTEERQQWFVFAERPYFQQLPVRLVTMRGRSVRDALVDGDTVSLVRLLDSPQHRLGLQQARRYGGRIDTVLADAGRLGAGIVTFSADTSLAVALPMMRGDRFDVTLGYTAEAEEARARLGITDELNYYPIAEADTLVPVYVSCARTPLGQRVIAAINARNAGAGALKAMRRAYLSYLPEVERRRFIAATGR